jgi:hypothetical protein
MEVPLIQENQNVADTDVVEEEDKGKCRRNVCIASVAVVALALIALILLVILGVINF